MKNKVKGARGGKNIQNARAKVENKLYSFEEGINLLKSTSFTKFNPTLELIINLGVDPRHSDQMVRGFTVLPAGTGNDVKVAVFCKDEKVSEAMKAGADFAGSLELIEKIKSGKADYDVYVSTPDMMGIVGQVARILGPKGKMPNPKIGTVSNDITIMVNNAKNGQAEFRTDKGGIVHIPAGKVSFATEDLLKNISSLVESVNKAKPTTSKGVYMKHVYLTTTMGPSVKIDISTI